MNKVATVLVFTSYIIIIIAIIAGFSMANTSKYPGDIGLNDITVFSWQTAIIWWVGGFVTGISFLGFAEIIKLLEKIYLRLNQD